MSDRYVVFAPKKEHKAIASQVEQVLERYNTFLLVEATEQQAEALVAAGYTVEEKGPQEHPTATLPPHPQAPDSGRHHYVVTFVGPVHAQWLDAVRQQGGIAREPLPPYGYVFELDAQALDDVRALPFVEEVTWYDPSRRVADEVLDVITAPAPRARRVLPTPPEEETRALGAETGEEAPEAAPFHVPERGEALVQQGVVRVIFYTEAQRDEAVQTLQGENVAARSLGAEAPNEMVVFLPQGADRARQVLAEVSRLHGVRSIQPVVVPGTSNDVAARLIGIDVVQSSLRSRPFDGTGELVAVVDTGLDSGDPAHLHPDFEGRVAGVVSWPISLLYNVRNAGADDGPADIFNGHGTHVAGSIVGSGKAARSRGFAPIRGMAPGARIFFQAVQQETILPDGSRTFALTGFPPDVGALLQQAYDAGARICNLSLQLGGAGTYDVVAQQIDNFIWHHPDMTVVVAAGNEGRDADGDGIVDAGSVTTPGTAKNVITVGAAESLRRNMGYTTPWGRLWPSDYPAPPQRDDLPSDNADHIAAFSGRGPTADGRIKPDVVAPGTNIVSTRSQALPHGKGGWGPYPFIPDMYLVNGGTSMATPIVTGAVAVLREYLRRVKRRRPSAALLKALIIHGAVYRPNPLHPQSGPFDNEQGWGHLRVDTLIHPRDNRKVSMYERRRGLMTGEHITRWADVVDDDVPLKVTLVWTDAPGTSRGARQLVNDLDLIVIAPDGRRFHGNQFTPPYDGAFDRVNNVEQVIIERPQKGRYWLRVQATNVLQGPQGFALVWSAAQR